MTSGERFSRMIDEVKQAYSNGVPWGVAVKQTASAWNLPANVLKKEISRRRDSVADAKRKQKERMTQRI